VIKAICRTTCWFNRHLYKENQRCEFPDGTKLPHHFEVIGASSKPAPKVAPKPKAEVEAEEKKAPPKKE
jgi:hypothetical protein